MSRYNILNANHYLLEISLRRETIPSFEEYPFSLPIIRHFRTLSPHPKITFIVGGNGLYLLDEPEAALSPTRQMSMLLILHRLVQKHSQFIIATHSPILLAYPDADIYQIEDRGLKKTAYEETNLYFMTKTFINNPKGMLARLFEED